MVDMRDMLYSIDPNTMVLGLLFVIFALFINFALTRILFKKERATSAIISLCISLLAVYGLNRIDFDVTGMFYSLGFSEDILYTVVPWIILGLAILGSFTRDDLTGRRKFRLYRLFLILGALLIALSFFVYEKTVLFVAGIILILIGLFLWFRHKKKLIPSSSNSNGRNALINAAKKFKSWASSQKNPKFVGSWANFVHWLGGNESAICQKYGVSQSEFVNIFNKYGLV